MSTEMLLVVISAVVLIVVATVLARKVGVAGPLVLVGVGVAVGYVPGIPAISVEPDLILVGILPRCSTPRRSRPRGSSSAGTRPRSAASPSSS